MQRSHFLVALLAAPLLLCTPAQAQIGGGKPIKVVAPAAPGGILDQTSRIVAKALSESLKQPVVVENVSGAGGTLGIQAMLRAEPDGTTLVMGSLGPNAANYTLQPNLPYKPEDLAPVIHVLSMPNVLVANPKLEAGNVAELTALSQRKDLSMAVSTSGSSGHLAGELIKNRAGMKAVNVVYRGAAPALLDLTGGQVDFMVDNMITALPLVRAGKLKALAVTTRQRARELPDVPTLAESGYPDIDVGVWLGIFASAKTPAPVVATLNRELQKVLASPEVQNRIAEQGGVAVGGSTELFQQFVDRERARWAQVIRDARIKVD